MSENPPAGWYPDPQDGTKQRYWDGTAWSEHTAPGAAATASASPIDGPGAPVSSRPDTWTWQSIVATLICCNVLGVAGVLNAGRAEQAANAGDLVAANRYAQQAKKWTLWAAGVSFGLVLVYIIFFFAVFAGSVQQF